MTNYEKFLKGDILPLKWFLRRDTYLLKLGKWNYILYTWRISRYKKVYYIFISKYKIRRGDVVRACFPHLSYTRGHWYYYESFSPEKAPPISSRLVSHKIIKKYKERTLGEFLKGPHSHVDEIKFKWSEVYDCKLSKVPKRGSVRL